MTAAVGVEDGGLAPASLAVTAEFAVTAAVGVEDDGLAPASLAVTVVSVEELPKMDTFGSCDTQNVTQFTCFTSTKVCSTNTDT